ncbi:MAG: hypothetical protein CMQ41_10520 [Gammaproteobacteria bacterium]|nr:hypothetical protein [Gammaproteobacteria bacterium]
MNLLQKKSSTATNKYRLTALFSLYGLLTHYAYTTHQVLLTISVGSLLIWLIQIFPLVLFAPGLHANILRSNIWLSFIVLLYFIHGVIVAFDAERTVNGIIEISLCISLFCSLVFLIKTPATS